MSHLVVWSPTLTLCGVQCTHNVQLECKQTVRDCFVSFPLPAFLALLGFCCPVLVVTSILLPLVWLWAQCNICTHSSYMVDAADHEKLDASKNELHSLLDKPQLAGIPVRPPSPLSIIFCPLLSPSPSFPAPLVDYSRKWIINSLGPKFSSQGHFHSLQLLNVPQFLFSRLVRLKTAPRGNFSHA